MILIVGFVAALSFSFVNIWIGLAIGFVVAHFFLFCNIARISRPPDSFGHAYSHCWPVLPSPRSSCGHWRLDFHWP